MEGRSRRPAAARRCPSFGGRGERRAPPRACGLGETRTAARRAGRSPAILIVAFPLAFRVTCYYYRRSYYRAFFWSPPACAVPDVRKSYAGETRFPFLIQNLHRYALIFATTLLIFLWWDVLLAFNFNGHFGIGLGSILMLANVILLSGYSASCHSLRYLVGGYLGSFHGKPLRFGLWSWANALNARHARWAWASLIVVGLTDLYIRLLSMGVLTDPRWVPGT